VKGVLAIELLLSIASLANAISGMLLILRMDKLEQQWNRVWRR